MKYPALIIPLLGTILALGGCKDDMMGGRHGMMHSGNPPQEYRQLNNPLPLTEKHLKAGEELYTSNCFACHGITGNGDGPAGVALDPAPANLRQTLWMPMKNDAYLNWRIAEGGKLFDSAMPAFKQSMSVTQRWQLIHYLKERL
ncbi:MAG: c-type cytochrome [Gammaproteobacteria bacterium]|nr:c-type cytochrome [Gammaproteobacteria bacterium]